MEHDANLDSLRRANHQIGAGMAAQLRATIAPYFMRRAKQDVLKRANRCTLRAHLCNPMEGDAVARCDSSSVKASGCCSADAGSDDSRAAAPAPSQLPHKNDLIVWLKLQPMQQRIYEVRHLCKACLKCDRMHCARNL